MHNPKNKECPKQNCELYSMDDIGGVCNHACTCPEQKEDWEEEFDILSDTQIFTIDGKKGTLKNIYIYESLKSFIRTQISLAEKRGWREGIECVDVLFETLETANAIGAENLEDIVFNQCANYRKLTQKS